MIDFGQAYGWIVILLVNILRTALLKRVMDLFLSVGQQNQKLRGFLFILYYLATAALYSVFCASAIYGLCRLAAILGIACFYQASFGKKLWISLVFFCVETGCGLAVFFVLSEQWISQQFAVSTLFLLVCATVLTGIPDPPEARELAFDKKQMSLLILVPALSVAVFFGMRYGGTGGFAAAFVCAAVVALNLCVFYLYHVLLQNYVQLREQDSYRQQVAAYQNQLEVIAESQSRIRALKHDMKNHILSLQVMAEEARQGEILEYLASMQEFMANPSELVDTKNEALDSLLNYKLQRARERLQTVETRLVIPEEMKLHSFDLNVVLGNLLDNAIAASERTRERFLSLDLRVDRGVLFLSMENSCEGISDGVCDLQKMAEKSAEGHGIGLANVRRIVEKYHGDLELRCESGRMKTEVMLYLGEL